MKCFQDVIYLSRLREARTNIRHFFLGKRGQISKSRRADPEYSKGFGEICQQRLPFPRRAPCRSDFSRGRPSLRYRLIEGHQSS